MSLSDIFALYLLPWAVALGAVVIIGAASGLATLMTGKVFRRTNTLSSSVVGAVLALAYLRVSLEHSMIGLPLSLQLSLGSYGACGALLAFTSIIGFWAVISEQADNLKRGFVAADEARLRN